jgi:ATP-binding cassette subfamily B protein
MTNQTAATRDRATMRAIHRLFWQGNFVNKPAFVVWLLTRPPAIFVYNILIPIQVAYGMQAIVERQFDQVQQHIVYIMLFALAYCVLWAIGGVAICRNAVDGAMHVQRKVFANFLQKDYEFYSNNYLGALSAQAIRLRDANSEYNQVFIYALPQHLIVVIASIVIIGLNSPLLALVTVICVGVVLSYTILSSRWRLKYRRLLTESSSQLSGVVSDALGQASTVKSFAAEAYEGQRLSAAAKTWAQHQYRSWLSSIPSDVGRMLLAAATTATLLLVAAKLYQQGSISIAVVALVQLYVLRLIIMTQGMADTIKAYESAMGGAFQSVVTMNEPTTVTDLLHPQKIPHSREAAVTFNAVTYQYPEASASRYAIHNFDLTIKPGEKIGLVGFSGSGKTTLTKLLLRFMDTTKGSIHINGVDIRDAAQGDVRQLVAYVPQEPLLFHRSIAENISYGRPAATKKAILAAAQAAHIEEFVAELPEGYDTIVGERGVKLSGGQRQRVAIARALLKDAPILVLDEATSALDSESEKLIQQALWRLMQDRTALVVAHRLSTIQRMDRIVVMDKGKIVQIGTHEELLQKKRGIYAKLWSHQSGGYVGVPEAKDGAAEG